MRERFSTQIIVRRLSPIKTGTTGDGTAYTISQVIATKPDGTPISDYNLRTFDALPTDCVISVDCELFRSERFGDSYTVKLKAGQAQQAPQGVTEQVADLKTRVDRIEDFLSGRGEFVGSAAEPAAPPPTAAPPPPPAGGETPPPAPPDVGGHLGGAGGPPPDEFPF